MFSAYWVRIETANPQLKPEATVTLSGESLKKRLRLAYEAGWGDAQKDLKSVRDLEDLLGAFTGGTR